MQKYFKNFKILWQQLRNRSITMQHRLMLYFLSIVSVILGILLITLTVMGLFSFSEQQVGQSLSMGLARSVTQITEQIDYINAQGIKLSNQVSTELSYLLQKNDLSFQDLNDNPAYIEELQQSVYSSLNTTLELCECSGAYIILDITTNSSLSNAAESRSGLYLRRTSVNDCNPVSSETALFRGIKEVARKNKLELHNRWNMEFDTKKLPFYQELRKNPPSRAVDSYFWTKKMTLTGTWEEVAFLVVPIIGNQGEFYGVCGIELSSLYFRLAYPSADSKFGTLVTVLAPYNQNTLHLSQGLCGAERGGKFTEIPLHSNPTRQLQVYTADGCRYFGLHQDVSISAPQMGDIQWAVAVLLPAANYQSYTARRRLIVFTLFMILLLILIAVSVFLSRRYVQPITQRIQAIQSGNINCDTSTGLSELDELLKFLQTQKQNISMDKDELPKGIQEIFDKFIECTKSLTDAERNILGYYINGYQIAEIPELAYISMSTVRKHNRSIYEKLEVSSRDELMLYIDLLRRCGRIDDITFHQTT